MRRLPVLALGLCAVAAPAATAQTAATLSADAVVVTVGMTIATLSQLNFGSVPKGVATTVAPNVAAAGEWQEISLLRRAELERLFGPALPERFGPLVKSWVSVRAPG